MSDQSVVKSNKWIEEPDAGTDKGTGTVPGGLKVTWLKKKGKRKLPKGPILDSHERSLKHAPSAPSILDSPTKSRITNSNSPPDSPDLDLIESIDPNQADGQRKLKKHKKEANDKAIVDAIALATKAASKAASEAASRIRCEIEEC